MEGEPSMQDMIGRRFGFLTVLEKTKDQSGNSIWKCQCDCGNITYAKTGHLNAGTKKSCGCLQREKQKDLTEQRFGKLVVLRKTEKRKRGCILWECRCDCGNICLKPTGELNWGTATSCGCVWRQPTVKAGERYGRLIALEPTEKRSNKSIVWKCKCDCGKIFEARATSLQSGHVNSCGCIKVEADKVKMLKNLTYQDDTCIEFLEKISVPTKANTTGVRGVKQIKDGRYEAGLMFRKKRYYLGRYNTLEEAAKARKQAEIMVEEYLEQYREENKTNTK